MAAIIKNKLKRYWYVLLIPILVVIFYFVALKTVHPHLHPNSDFFSFWLAGHMAVLGQNPYSADLWIEAHHIFGAGWISDETFLYPLPLSIIFAPFGLLTLYQAFIVWNILTQVMITASIALLLKLYSNPKIKHYIFPLFAGVVLFRATIITLINGQLSGVLLFLLASITYLWEKGKWWQGAILLPILALKPNLGVPVIGLLVLYLLIQKKFSAVISCGISGLAIIFVGFIQNPGWIIEYLGVGQSKLSQTFGYSPTIWGMSAHICKFNKICLIGLGGGLSLLLFAGFIYLLLKKRGNLSPMIVVSFAIIIMLLVTPYTWPYDQLFLVIPIIAVTMGLAESGYKFLPGALIFIFVDILAVILLIISASVRLEIWNAVVPLSVLVLLIWYIYKPASPVMRED